MSEFLAFVRGLPKAELHLHIEGTLEPEMLMTLADRHGVNLPYASVADVRRAYDFDDLQSFLDLYYLGAGVLREQQDFYELMMAYLARCHDEGTVHAEVMFDPQTHTDRGIDFSVFMSGFNRATADAKAQWGITVYLIMSFLRHLSEAEAFETLKAAEPYRSDIMAVGLDSAEMGHPPEDFAGVFKAAAEQGYRLVAHAGEEGPPAYVRSALDVLKVERIDHGVRSMEDDELITDLVKMQTPLTVCPLSNIRLRVFDTLAAHPLLDMLSQGLNVSVNADDPPYFGGYLLENFSSLHDALGLTQVQATKLAVNSIIGSFLPENEKQRWLAEISDYTQQSMS